MKNILQKLDLLWAFIGFCAGSVLMTWPLSLHLKTSVIGGMGDNIYFVWLIRWYQKVFLEGQGHPFFNPLINYPQGWNLSTTETALASAQAIYRRYRRGCGCSANPIGYALCQFTWRDSRR